MEMSAQNPMHSEQAEIPTNVKRRTSGRYETEARSAAIAKLKEYAAMKFDNSATMKPDSPKWTLFKAIGKCI